jgi:DNA-binding MarR family transcriptional regulator
MSRDARKRTDLLVNLNEGFRQLSAATILFHQAIADRLGMNITDHKCADVLARQGAMTAGDLASYTGLTTGAITGVIDRLEKAGFVRRVKDPDDRRRVIVEPLLKRMEQVIAPLFQSMGRSAAELCQRYSTEELAVIHDFTVRCQELAIDETRNLRTANVGTRDAKRSKTRTSSEKTGK